MSILYNIVKEDPSISNYIAALNRITKRKQYIYNAFLQLTPICNFKCTMCYARMSKKDIEKKAKHVMRFDEWKYYIDSLLDMGTVEITLTGGECTLHPDFDKIYSYCYDKGASITVMTNASAITDQLLALFADKPPRAVSITVYGFSPDTYERLCDNRAAYKKVYTNIEKLKTVTMEVYLKYTTVKENINDLLDTERYFREKGFILNPVDTLIQFERCDDEVLKEETVNHERFKRIMCQIYAERTGRPVEEVAKHAREESEYCEIPQNVPSRKTGISCSATRNSCQIDWEGHMTPCVAFDAIILDPRELGFEESWRRLVEWGEQVPVIEECVTCPFKYNCNTCVALHYNDLGEFGKPSPRLCWKRLHPEEAERIMRERSQQ